MKRIPALVAASALLLAACGRATGDSSGDRQITPTISASESHSCALAADGTAWCWGDNYGGALGDGTTIPWLSPHEVSMPVGVRFSALDAGPYTTCALSTDGAAWCWGFLGDPEDGSPAAVPMPDGVTFSAISTAGGDACGLGQDGSAWCWGADTEVGGSSEPTPIGRPEGVSFSAIAASSYSHCAIATDGSVWCWPSENGAEVNGQQWAPTAVRKEAGAEFAPFIAAEYATDAESRFCAISVDGTPWCWTGSQIPSPAPTGDLKFSAVAPSSAAACGVTNDSKVYCWGDETSPLLGDIRDALGNVRDEISADGPIAIRLPGDRTFTAVSTSLSHACAAASDVTYWCWGDNYDGRLGIGSQEQDYRYRAVAVLPLGSPPIAPPGYLEPDYIPWTGDIPIWPLSFEETSDLYVEWWHHVPLQDVAWLSSIGLPTGCSSSGESPPSEPFMACFGRYWMERGVSEAAARFFGETGIVIFAKSGDGPVQVLWGAELGALPTTGQAHEHFIATPDGIIPTHYGLGWALWTPAFDNAYASQAYMDTKQASYTPDFWGLSKVRLIGPPERTGSGWTVPVVTCLTSDNWCGGSFAGRFEMHFDAQGVALDARFLDICWDDGLPEAIAQLRGSDMPVDALERFMATQPQCQGFGPWDLLDKR